MLRRRLLLPRKGTTNPPRLPFPLPLPDPPVHIPMLTNSLVLSHEICSCTGSCCVIPNQQIQQLEKHPEVLQDILDRHSAVTYLYYYDCHIPWSGALGLRRHSTKDWLQQVPKY